MQLTNREKHIQAQELLHPKCHALMWKYMSRESMEAVLGHADYDEDTHRNEPLQLYLSIKATHTVGGGAADATTRRARTRQAYKSAMQGPYEDQVEYKHRFTYLLEAAKAAGNVEIPAADVAMDYLHGLDNGRFAKFKVDLDNDISKGVAPPQTLSAMFQRAASYKVVSTSRSGRGAVFATRAEDMRPQDHNGGRGGGKGAGRSSGRGRGRGGKGGRGGRGDAEKASKPPVVC
jgi:hypothetical protein